MIFTASTLYILAGFLCAAIAAEEVYEAYKNDEAEEHEIPLLQEHQYTVGGEV